MFDDAENAMRNMTKPGYTVVPSATDEDKSFIKASVINIFDDQTKQVISNLKIDGLNRQIMEDLYFRDPDIASSKTTDLKTYKVINKLYAMQKSSNQPSNDTKSTNPVLDIEEEEEYFNEDGVNPEDEPKLQKLPYIPESKTIPEEPIMQENNLIPNCKVSFEIEGFGNIDAYYHDVVLDNNGTCVVLLYNNSYKNGLKYFPRENSEIPMFINADNLPHLYKVVATGIKYTVGNVEHYIMFIDSKAPKSEGG